VKHIVIRNETTINIFIHPETIDCRKINKELWIIDFYTKNREYVGCIYCKHYTVISRHEILIKTENLK